MCSQINSRGTTVSTSPIITCTISNQNCDILQSVMICERKLTAIFNKKILKSANLWKSECIHRFPVVQSDYGALLIISDNFINFVYNSGYWKDKNNYPKYSQPRILRIVNFWKAMKRRFLSKTTKSLRCLLVEDALLSCIHFGHCCGRFSNFDQPESKHPVLLLWFYVLFLHSNYMQYTQNLVSLGERDNGQVQDDRWHKIFNI